MHRSGERPPLRGRSRIAAALVAMLGGGLLPGAVAPAVAAAEPSTASQGFIEFEAPAADSSQVTVPSLTTVTPSASDAEVVRLRASDAPGNHVFTITLAAHPGATLQSGTTYDNAVEASTRSAGQPGIDVEGGPQTCTAPTGRFIVDEAPAFDAGGNLQTFSARWEQRCDGAEAAMNGAVSYQSSAPFRARNIAPFNSCCYGYAVGTGSDIPATVTNWGPSDLHVAGGSLQGDTDHFKITGSTCSDVTLPPEQSCTVTVRFEPLGTSDFHATLTITDDVAPWGHDIPLHGSGVAPLPPPGDVPPPPPPVEPPPPGGTPAPSAGFRLTPTSLAFEARIGYVSDAQVITLQNMSGAALHLSHFELRGSDAEDFGAATDCDTVVEANETCVVGVVFAPSRGGSHSAGLSIAFEETPYAQGISLSGTGTFGYYVATAEGDVLGLGDAVWYGDIGGERLNKPIVAMATTAATLAEDGYWMVATDGGIFAFGDAPFYGSTGNIPLNKPIVGMAPTSSGEGYWLVASDGGIFAFGDAPFYGSTGNISLAKPIVGMTPTPSGEGYWLVASDGGIFAFGDAPFYGSTGKFSLAKPIVGMAASPTGEGYWFVAEDGGIFAFGDAGFYGSTGAIRLAEPIAGMAATPTGKGYWFVAEDGGIFAFGDAPFMGSGVGAPSPVIGIVGTATVW